MSLTLAPEVGFCNDSFSLVAVLGCDLPVGGDDLGRRQNLLAIPSMVGRDLCRFRSGESASCDCFNNLLPARAGGVRFGRSEILQGNVQYRGKGWVFFLV